MTREIEDFQITYPSPHLRTSGRLVRLSTDAEPSQDDDGGTLQVGTELYREDTGRLDYWTGSAWAPVTAWQKFQQLIEVLTEVRDALHQQEESDE